MLCWLLFELGKTLICATSRFDNGAQPQILSKNCFQMEIKIKNPNISPALVVAFVLWTYDSSVSLYNHVCRYLSTCSTYSISLYEGIPVLTYYISRLISIF